MTVQEWLKKRIDANREFLAEKEAGTIPPETKFEDWRVTKGYIVDGREGLTTDEGHG